MEEVTLRVEGDTWEEAMGELYLWIVEKYSGIFKVKLKTPLLKHADGKWEITLSAQKKAWDRRYHPPKDTEGEQIRALQSLLNQDVDLKVARISTANFPEQTQHMTIKEKLEMGVPLNLAETAGKVLRIPSVTKSKFPET